MIYDITITFYQPYFIFELLSCARDEANIKKPIIVIWYIEPKNKCCFEEYNLWIAFIVCGPDGLWYTVSKQ